MYIGTRIVHLRPMSKGQYNEYRGWNNPADEDPFEEGYLVEYTDGGKPNDPRHAGYISWSPKAQADAAYRHTDALTFGLAVEAMRKGFKVAREGWNGKGMYLVLVEWWTAPNIPEPLAIAPWIGMKTANNCFVPWLASQTDVLAEDWVIMV